MRPECRPRFGVLLALVLVSSLLLGCGAEGSGGAKTEVDGRETSDDSGRPTPHDSRSDAVELAEGHVVAYVRIPGGTEDQLIRLDPPASRVGVDVPNFAGFSLGPVSRDGTRVASRTASDPHGYLIRQWDAAPDSGFLTGTGFDWNPSGSLGAYNVDVGGPLVVVEPDENGVFNAVAGLAETAAQSSYDDLEFHDWVTDDTMFVSSGSTRSLATIGDGELSLTAVDVENPNYPRFDRRGNGLFVDGDRLRRVDPGTGEVTELASITPSPRSDYISSGVEWSYVADQFGFNSDDGTFLCDWDGSSLSCSPVPLPAGFASQGGPTFSPDGSVVGYNIVGPDLLDWRPVLLDPATMVMSELAYECPKTCYLDAFMIAP